MAVGLVEMRVEVGELLRVGVGLVEFRVEVEGGSEGGC